MLKLKAIAPIAFVLFGFAVGIMASPLPDYQLGPFFDAAADSETPVVLSEFQVKLLNKVIRERDDEYGFCFNRIGSDHPIGLSHPENVDYADSTNLNMECPAGYEGRIHTHPGGTTEMSPKDERLLRDKSHTVSCIVSGDLFIDQRDQSNMKCYMTDGPGDLKTISVKITDN